MWGSYLQLRTLSTFKDLAGFIWTPGTPCILKSTSNVSCAWQCMETVMSLVLGNAESKDMTSPTTPQATLYHHYYIATITSLVC